MNPTEKKLLNCPTLVAIYKISFKLKSSQAIDETSKFPFTILDCDDLGLDDASQDIMIEASDEIGDRFHVVYDPQSKKRKDEKLAWEIFSIQDNLVEIKSEFAPQQRRVLSDFGQEQTLQALNNPQWDS